MKYPIAKDTNKVGTYELLAHSGGGYFYDEVLEYRVWVHPINEEIYCRAFGTYAEALEFSKNTIKAESPLVLVYQEEYIDETKPGEYTHIKSPRISEWKPEWLDNSKNSKKNIPIFLNKVRRWI